MVTDDSSRAGRSKDEVGSTQGGDHGRGVVGIAEYNIVCESRGERYGKAQERERVGWGQWNQQLKKSLSGTPDQAPMHWG
jgi:hypothetical protein